MGLWENLEKTKWGDSVLTIGLIHPQLLEAIAKCGHGDKILISDGNYPLDSKSGNAEKIYLGLSKDCPTVTDILRTLKSVVSFEKAELMSPAENNLPEIFKEFHSLLDGVEFECYSRQEFYDICQRENVKVAIMSGESRTYANILLTIGVS